MSKTASNVKMTQKEIQEYQEAFSFFDTDRDGYINTTEVGKVMRSVGLYPTEAELQQITKSNRNKIDFNEFLNYASKNIVENKVNEQQMREAFKMVSFFFVNFNCFRQLFYCFFNSTSSLIYMEMVWLI